MVLKFKKINKSTFNNCQIHKLPEVIEKRSFFLKIFIFLFTKGSTVKISCLKQMYLRNTFFLFTFSKNHCLKSEPYLPVVKKPICRMAEKKTFAAKFKNRTKVRQQKWRRDSRKEAVKWDCYFDRSLLCIIYFYWKISL